VSTQAMRPASNLWIQPGNIGLAVLGVLVTHESAYSLVSSLPFTSAVLPDHNHQAVLWTVGIPAALWAVVALIIRQAAQLGLSATISRRRLAALIAGLYLLQETVEAVIGGHGLGALIDNRAVLMGLIITPLVATILLRLLAVTSRIVAGWLAPTLAPAAPTIAHGSAGRSMVHGWNIEPGDPRGPPFEIVPKLILPLTP